MRLRPVEENAMKAGHEIPVNATAGRVMSSGEHHEYLTNSSVDSPLPLPLREIDSAISDCPGFKDLSGLRVGRLRVVGLSTTLRRWVCRCDCGIYTLRTPKALKNGSAAPCSQCYMLARAKRLDLIRRTGKSVNSEDFL